MTEPAQPDFPAVSIAQAYKILTAPGMPYEMQTISIRGRPTRVYKNAPPHLRALLDASRQWGARDFIVFEDERLTYDAHYRAVSALAHVLADRFGVVKGDRVAIAMRNLPEWSIAFWAGIAIGAVVTPLNGWGTGDDLNYGVSDSGARVAILDAERLQRLQPYLHELHLAGVIAVRTPREDLGPAVPLEDLIGPAEGYAALPDRAPPDPGLEPEDDATILYTSGTTGRPKGALGTHRNAISNLISVGFSAARAVVRRTGAPPPPPPADAPQGAMLLPVPLFHVTGSHSVLIPALTGGAKMVLMYRWSPAKALELIEREKIGALTGVPTMIWQLLECPDFATRDTSSLLGMGYGGAAAAPELTQRVRQLFPNFWPGQGYGATETTSVATANAGEDYMRKPDSVGLTVPVDDIKIVDAEDNTLPPGGVGEICVYGPNVVKGYWNKPEATAAAFVDGWYHTGDVGRMDEEGFVYVMDRIKDMLIRGGENIYCVEIEDALFAHPAVIDAAVVGLPHRVLGEEVGAAVRLREGASASQSELRAHVARLLPAHKVPVVIDVRGEELPKNASGKTLKSVLRDQLRSSAKSA
ncbi:MAG: class I adenylate-forming enzyme family protein [Caulobacterales bacterium]